MATLDYNVDGAIAHLERVGGAMWRTGKKRIVMAGAQMETDLLKKRTDTFRHVESHAMQRAIGSADYHEDLDGASVAVYPQGTDGRGVSNALKAFVIDRGLGRNPTRRGTANKTGDHFITGSAPTTEGPVLDAMEAEANRILEEVNG